MIEDEIKKLRDNPSFQRIYNKWKKKRSRNKDKLSLRQCRENALREFYTRFDFLKTIGKDKTTNDTTIVVQPSIPTYPKINKHQLTPIVYNHSEHRFMTLKEYNNWRITDPIARHLLSIFAKDHKPKRQRTVNLWNE